MSTSLGVSLDEDVALATRAAASLGLPAPDALVMVATGVDSWPASLDQHQASSLAEVDGVPVSWHGTTLHTGIIGEATLWVLNDAPTVPAPRSERPWARAFPVWWAAAVGARGLLHTTAGTALTGDTAPHIALIKDHINLSGGSALTGLGESRLGPLFPDQTRVHDERLRALALETAASLKLELRESIAACVHGPAIATQAELRWQRSCGADLSVQDLAPILVAAAHAGLPAIAICAATDHADQPGDVESLVQSTSQLAPSLERFGRALASQLHRIDTR